MICVATMWASATFVWDFIGSVWAVITFNPNTNQRGHTRREKTKRKDEEQELRMEKKTKIPDSTKMKHNNEKNRKKCGVIRINPEIYTLTEDS